MKNRENPPNKPMIVVRTLIPSFAAGVIISVALVISLPAAVILFFGTAAVTVTVSASTVSLAISAISWSYRLTIATGDAS